MVFASHVYAILPIVIVVGVIFMSRYVSQLQTRKQKLVASNTNRHCLNSIYAYNSADCRRPTCTLYLIVVVSTHAGPLEEVGSLMAVPSPSSISLSWERPFSLDITDVQPDIVYCVDVFRISPGVSSRDHVASDCGLLDSIYNFTTAQPDPRNFFQFVVTPRNHVAGARNGTTSVINGSFSFESEYNNIFSR